MARRSSRSLSQDAWQDTPSTPTKKAVRSSRLPAPLAWPTWDDLAASAVSLDTLLPQQLPRLKAKPLPFTYRITRAIIITMMHDANFQKFLRYQWSEIIDLMADQVARNRLLSLADYAPQRSAPISDRTNTQIFREFSQMPCTPDTALRRVRKVGELVDKNEKILLLGDDDMVSVELAKAGFRHVTAIDICPKVLKHVHDACQAAKVQVKLLQHDLSQPLPEQIARDHALVLFDPQYSVPGVELFLKAALQATADNPSAQFFISVHLMTLLRDGMAALAEVFSQQALEIMEFHQGFNVYPVPARLKGLIDLINLFVIRSKALATEGWSFPFFLSDAIILRKRPA